MAWETSSNTEIVSIGSDVNQLQDAQIVHVGTSPGSNTVTSITLQSTASAIDGVYDPGMVVIYDGMGMGQARRIYQYDGTTKTAYINRDWKILPDATSKYMIMFHGGNGHVNEGIAQGGGANTITLNSLASSQNSLYLGQLIFIVAGTGQDQSRMCIGYNGTTKVATVDAPWIVQPDSTTIYVVMPFPGFIHGVPAQDSLSNVLMRDVVGNKNDLVDVPYVEAQASILGFLHTGYYHVHGTSFTYPDHADGITLTSASGVWAIPANTTELVPENTLSVDNFDLHWIEIYDLDTVSEYQIDIFTGNVGEEVRICSPVTQRTSNFSREGPQPLQIPQQLVNKRISAKLSTSVSGVCNCKVKLIGHYYTL